MKHFLLLNFIMGLLINASTGFAMPVGHLGTTIGNNEQLCLFLPEECTRLLGGVSYPNGECLKKTGGSFSYEYRTKCPDSKSLPVVNATYNTQNYESFCAQKLASDVLIYIADDWYGFARCSLQSAHFEIEKSQGKYIANGLFTVSIRGKGSVTETTKVVIPNEVITKFLFMLEATTIKPGTYTPNIDRSDNHPTRVIIINTKDSKDKKCYFSQSQNNIPWGVFSADKEYSIDSPVPAQALELLKPYLKIRETNSEMCLR